jgi:hypothetical protein
MWIDVRRYKDYKKLFDYQNILNLDIKNWLRNNDPIKNTEPVYEERASSQESYGKLNPDGTITSISSKFSEPPADPTKNPEEYAHRKDWRCVGGFYERTWNTKIIKESLKALTMLSGLKQLNINFLCPFGKITSHLDDGGWKKISEDWGKETYGYSIVQTIQSGMTESSSELVGMRVNNVDKYPLVGELVCFDGIKGLHSMWNNTNIWRITAVYDIDINAFNKYSICG